MGEVSAKWRAFREFATASGYDARPVAENDFASFVRSNGDSAGWLGCMLRCSPGCVILVPHPAVELRFVACDGAYAYLEEWHTRLRHRLEVPSGHFLSLVHFEGVAPFIALALVGPTTSAADLALNSERRARGEPVSAPASETRIHLLDCLFRHCLDARRCSLAAGDDQAVRDAVDADV